MQSPEDHKNDGIQQNNIPYKKRKISLNENDEQPIDLSVKRPKSNEQDKIPLFPQPGPFSQFVPPQAPHLPTPPRLHHPLEYHHRILDPGTTGQDISKPRDYFTHNQSLLHVRTDLVSVKTEVQPRNNSFIKIQPSPSTSPSSTSGVEKSTLNLTLPNSSLKQAEDGSRKVDLCDITNTIPPSHNQNRGSPFLISNILKSESSENSSIITQSAYFFNEFNRAAQLPFTIGTPTQSHKILQPTFQTSSSFWIPHIFNTPQSYITAASSEKQLTSPCSITSEDSGISPDENHRDDDDEEQDIVVDDDCSDAEVENSRERNSNELFKVSCNHCGQQFEFSEELHAHRCFSSEEKSFHCNMDNCDKVYNTPGALKMHIRTHTLPCKCHLCGKSFSRPWLLQGHLRTHTGEKPFECHVCSRSFADKSNLRAHLQTHETVKKYRCTDCTKTFSRMSLLHKHREGACQKFRLRSIALVR